MKHFLISFFVVVFVTNIFAQSSGDYRSSTSGDWSDASTWERYNGSAWVAAVSPPSSSNGVITIKSGTIVSISSAITVDQLVIEAGGTLDKTDLSTLNFAQGAGTDFSIYGTFVHSPSSGGSSAMYLFAGGTLVEVFGGGIIEIAGNGGSSGTPNNARIDWADGSYPVTWYTDAVFHWTGSIPSTINVTYFLNAGSEIPIFWNNQGASIGSNSQTTFNGIFRSSNDLTIQNGGVKTFRNGIQLDAGVTITQPASSGAFTISGTAILNMGAGAAINLNSAGMNVASTSVTTLTSAITINGSGIFSVISGGTLALGNLILSGAAPFTLNSGGILKIGHVQGISNSGATGNIQSTGSRTFMPGGTYEYYGVNGQQITGTGLPTTINSTGKIIVNNTDHVVQSTNYTVNGALEIISGCLITNQQLMTIGSTASLVYNSSSFVCTCLTNGFSPASTGGLTRTAGNAFFPVGPETSKYMPATITNAGTSDQFNVRVENLIAANVAPYATDYFIQRQWIISESVAGGSNTTIRLQWASGEEGALFNPNTNPIIGRWTGSVLQKVSGTYNAGDPSVSASPFTAFSIFVVGASSALPISLLHFTATPNNNHTDLLWATATETQNAYFAVERSADGVHFDEITQVPGAGNSAVTKNYAYTDRSPLNGPNYYRLRQVDFDGAYSFSPVRRVVFGEANGVRLQPVPATETLQVLLDKTTEEDINWSVFDQSGRLVLDGQAAEETQQFDVDVQNLPQGIYMLRLTSGQFMHAVRFVKQ